MKIQLPLKIMATTLSLAVLAGCSSMGGGQDGNSQYGDGSNTSSTGASATGLNDGSGVKATGLGEQTNRFGVKVDSDGIPLDRTIYFGYDSDRIGEEYSDMLYSHAEYLKAHMDTKITLKGHTDERGTREYNMALSERRANSVKKFMMIMDVPSNQMRVVGYGEERPAVRGNTEEAFAKNRRVTISY
jgi:peptidoglycan-associated lipoprotein